MADAADSKSDLNIWQDFLCRYINEAGQESLTWGMAVSIMGVI